MSKSAQAQAQASYVAGFPAHAQAQGSYVAGFPVPRLLVCLTAASWLAKLRLPKTRSKRCKKGQE